MKIKFTLLLLALGVMFSPPVLVAQEPREALISSAKTRTDVPDQLSELPPAAILKAMDEKFKSIKPTMTESDVFETHGLAQYQEHLKAISYIRLDGGGGNWRVFFDNHKGYSLAFRDFLGHGKADCMILTPQREFWSSAKTSIPAVTVKQLQESLNRQIPKLQKRQVPNAGQAKVGNEKTVQIFLLERKRLEGITHAKGRTVGCGEGAFLYAHRTPVYSFSNEDIASCAIHKEVANVLAKSSRFRVDVELTETAKAELMRRFRKFDSTVWWTVSIDGKLRRSSNTFHQSWTEVPKVPVKTFSTKKEADAFQEALTR